MDDPTRGRSEPAPADTSAPPGAAIDAGVLRSLRLGATLVHGLPAAVLEVRAAPGAEAIVVGGHPVASMPPCMLRGALSAVLASGERDPLGSVLGFEPSAATAVTLRTVPPSSIDLRGGCWATRVGPRVDLVVPTVLDAHDALAVADDALARRRADGGCESGLTWRAGADAVTDVTVLLASVSDGWSRPAPRVLAARAVAAALVVEEACRDL